MVENRKPKRKESVLTEEVIAEYREAFRFYDRNSDGLITTKEVGAVLRSLGQNPTESEIRELIYTTDVNRSGTLDFEDFVRMMSGRHSAMDEVNDMIDAFKVFDRNGDGFISSVELKQAMETLGERLSSVEVDTMIRAADINGDEKINYEEFVLAMSAGIL